MARIKHIALRTPDPEKTAAFYKKVFGLEEVGLARSGVYLSDGYINLAILKSNDGGTGESPRDVDGYAGIDHLGFQVENLEEITRVLEEEGATPTNQRIDRAVLLIWNRACHLYTSHLMSLADADWNRPFFSDEGLY